MPSDSPSTAPCRLCGEIADRQFERRVPSVDIERIFTRQPDVHLLSTSLYSSQDRDWSYLWPSTGRHVFFYSPEAMRWVGRRYGYEVLSVGDLTVFYRQSLGWLKKKRLEHLLSGKSRRYRRVLFDLRRKTSRAAADRAIGRYRRGTRSLAPWRCAAAKEVR